VSATAQRVPGVISADLNFASATLLVEYEPGTDPRAAVVEAVLSTGHGLESLDEDSGPAGAVAERRWLDRYRAEIATAGSGVFAGLGIVAGWLGAPEVGVTVLFAIAIAFGGLLVWRRALVSLSARILDMNVLMSLAVFGAMALGEWGEGATVFFLFALGGLLESRSLERTRRSIRSLMDLTPPVARVRRGGTLTEVGLDQVLVGDIVVVRPGERVPVDGTVKIGFTAVDESPITGESAPVDKTVGDHVFAGTLNTTGLVDVEATAAATDSTLARIVYLVEEAQASRAPSQTFIDRFSRVYTPAVIALAAAVAVVPIGVAAVTGTLDTAVAAEWVRRALVVLVVSCPCALVISTPVSIVSGITRASRDGVLVKGGAFLETAASVGAVAFDKTGTLTAGRFEFAGIAPLTPELSGDGALTYAAALESHSNHPIARAIVAAATEPLPDVDEFAETPGRGVSGTIAGVRFELCSPRCAEESGLLGEDGAAAIASAEERGQTTLALQRDGRPVALLGVADALRPEAPAALAALRRLGLSHLVMLTGDNERVAEAVASRLELTSFLARLLPEAKTEAVGLLKERFGTVAMVGDGVNDAPALAAADIGIAMGAAGTDTALETADVALMRDDLSALPGFFALARRTVSTIRVNVAFSIGIKAVFLVLALTGQATLWMAVFADTGVSLLVILNGMRLLRRRAA